MTPTYFLWVSQIALIQPIHSQGYILIFLDRMHLLFTQVHFLFWQLGWVGGQYTTSSLDCKALCNVLSFLVLYLICWRSSLVHFKHGPEYLTKGTALVLIPLMRFLLYSLVSNSFLLLRYSFLIFFYLPFFDGVYFEYSKVLVSFLILFFSLWVFPKLFLVLISFYFILIYFIVYKHIYIYMRVDQ